MSEIDHLLSRMLHRYWRHVAARTGLIVMAGVGCVAALLWRLHGFGLGLWWLVGAGVVGIGALALWQGWAVKRDWLSRGNTLLAIDRKMGLQARLVTAGEFAHVANPPLLYPVLVEETSRSLPSVSKHVPRVFNRWTVGLIAVLLLLLLFPWPGVAPTIVPVVCPTCVGDAPAHPAVVSRTRNPTSSRLRIAHSYATGNRGA